MKHISVLLFAGLLLWAAGCTPHHINIVPEPVQVTPLNGKFTITAHTPLVFPPAAANSPAVTYIKEYFAIRFGVDTTASGTAGKAIAFSLAMPLDPTLHNEGYALHVSENGITVHANREAGWVYALQTLRQLAPASSAATALPAVTITDYPRFAWRGSMLDVSRHFFEADFIKKYLDVMALYKLNKFHWHLTDDHGWRIQIDKYPKLTEIGAWRADRSGIPWNDVKPPEKGEPTTYGGFYTKAQIREIVAYAAQRNIEIIPEIDLPGHCSAILAAYPELSCDHGEYPVETGPYWPPKAILCGGNDKVMDFLNDVIDEVAELFPSAYIHVGGDEAVKTKWETCPKCRQRIKSQSLHNEAELQSWMIREVERHVMSKGKKIIGWDEIMEGGVTQSATIMYWRGWLGDTIAVNAVRHGNPVIMTPNDYCYLDYYQTDPALARQEAAGSLPIEKVYAFEPVPTGLTADEAARIRGGQANLWAEFLFAPENVEYMLLPRLLAFSETVWSPKESKNWERFLQKLPAQKTHLNALGYMGYE
jgi:hexosaminidase